MDFYQICSNYAPEAQICSNNAPEAKNDRGGAHMFYKGLHRENMKKKYSSLKPKGIEP